MSAKRAAAATMVLALLGLVISGVIASVHGNLDASPGYASFCNVSESVNCDVVLSSEYAYFLSLPVAWWGVLAYLGFGAGAALVVRAARASRRRQVATALFAGAVGGILYSAFLAFVALVVLRAVCLLCTGLYLVNAGLLVSTSFLLSAAPAQGRGAAKGGSGWHGRTRWLAACATAAVVVFLVFAGWEALAGRDAQDPEFERWYMGLPVADEPPSGGHGKGAGGKVVIAEFSDFECGHCAKAYRDLQTVLPRFGNDVQLVFHHFPLDSTCNPGVPDSFHRKACLAAMAAECAAAQGRFWEYHDVLFDNQGSLGRQSLIAYANQLGLDRDEFVACLDSDVPRRAVARDVSEGERLGIASTPTFFLNGRAVRGALDAGQFEQAIRLERSLQSTGG